MRKNGSITKSFSSKEALVKWVVQTYSRRWADELMVNEEGPSTSRGPQLASPPLRPPPPVPPTPTPRQPSSRAPPPVPPPPPPPHTSTQSQPSSKGKALLRKPNQPAKSRSLVVRTTLPAGTGSAEPSVSPTPQPQPSSSRVPPPSVPPPTPPASSPHGTPRPRRQLLLRRPNEPAKLTSPVVIRTALPIGTGVIRIQDATDAATSLHEALGRQHSSPKSIEMVKGDIDRFLLTSSRECIGTINRAATTNRHRRDILVYASFLNLCIPNRFWNDVQHEFIYALAYPVQQDGTVNSNAQLSRVGTDLRYETEIFDTLYIVNPIQRAS